MAAVFINDLLFALLVSTHSHPKVAAKSQLKTDSFFYCFNTQPPEGGCTNLCKNANLTIQFQHTATRRWLPIDVDELILLISFNTQPPEGGCSNASDAYSYHSLVSTHSHPKVAAWDNSSAIKVINKVSTHSHPKVAAPCYVCISWDFRFQHTATRRWLRWCTKAPY